MEMKAFVIMYNRLTWPQALCKRLTEEGCEVILIDNGSTYPPLLEWYKTCPYKIHYMPEWSGHKSLWLSGIINEYKDEYYLVTDHDLDLSLVPKGFIDFLLQGLKYDIVKSGLSLKLDDLPDNEYTKEVLSWEGKFWKTERSKEGFYFSDIDTTLAVYARDRVPIGEFDNRFFSAVRSPQPYEARHLPWYNTPENMTEEEKYYLSHIAIWGYWSGKFKQIWKQ